MQLATALEFEDLLDLPFLPGGRSRAGYDCAGLLIELYQRAGISLPDPDIQGRGALRDELRPIEWPTSPLDIVHVTSDGKERILCLVHADLALGARERDGVFAIRVDRLRRVSEIRTTAFYRHVSHGRSKPTIGPVIFRQHAPR